MNFITLPGSSDPLSQGANGECECACADMKLRALDIVLFNCQTAVRSSEACSEAKSGNDGCKLLDHPRISLTLHAGYKRLP